MKDLFCSREQKMTAHQGRVDQNGEFVFTCTSLIETVSEENQTNSSPCGAFTKFPADTTPEKLDELIAVEAEANMGQVSIEAQESVLEKMLTGESVPQEEISTVQEEVLDVQEQPVETQPEVVEAQPEVQEEVTQVQGETTEPVRE